MKQLTFQKIKRLRTNAQFKAVLDRRLRAADELLTLYVAENDCGYCRLGVSVGKNVGNAVARNRVKRLIREAFRQNQEKLPAGHDYLVMMSAQWLGKLNDSSEPKRVVKELSFERVGSCLLALAMKATAKTQ